MDVFSQYAKTNKKNITELNFVTELKTFLNVSQIFRQDIKFSQDDENVEASRILGFMKNSRSSTFQKDAMLSLREDLANKSPLDVYPIARPFIFFEQYAITSRETIRNLIIAALAVFIVTSPFLVDCTVSLLVVLNFVALICELFGLMVLWDVSLNSVSMINLVMAIGFAVDYSAHIAHAYVISQEATANERVVDALSTLGASVFMGGFSTFLGMVVLAFATSEIFRIFFRMFLGIVVFGLIHGLCILPVYLSLFCWRPAVTRPSSSRITVESKNPSENVGSMANLNDAPTEGTPESVCRAFSNDAFELGDVDKAIGKKHAVLAKNVNRTEVQINTSGTKKGSIKKTGIQDEGIQTDAAQHGNLKDAEEDNRQDEFEADNGSRGEVMKTAEYQNEWFQADSREETEQLPVGGEDHQHTESDEIILRTDNIDTKTEQETVDSASEPARKSDESVVITSL